MRTITVAATQMACGDDRAANLAAAEAMVREAARAGAAVVLLQELFELPYFCKDQDPRWFAEARPLSDSPAVVRLSALAAELGVVLPVSLFERANQTYYNALAVIDADGRVVGHYRKGHIPDGPGYQEKFYFAPGDRGVCVVDTRVGRIGVGICWDQWFPELARVMALAGAELLFYPTAIGSEPPDPTLDSRPHWQRVMQGHAGANLVPVVASNRIGTEVGQTCTVAFYGRSFIAGPRGELVAEADETTAGAITATFDLDQLAIDRAAWGLFRDRRPDLYRPILTRDGAA